MLLVNYLHDIRRLLRWTWIYFLYFAGFLRRARYKISATSGVIVLTLHRVLPRAEFENTASPRGMVVSRVTFEQLLAFLKKHCDVLDLSVESPDWHWSGARPRVAITFDDGWKDTSEIAFPLLHSYGIPATVFVCPGLVGKSFPFWPELITRAWKAAGKEVGLSNRFASICSETLSGGVFFPAADDHNDLEQLIRCIKELPSNKKDLLVQELSSLTARDSSDSECFPLEATMSWHESKAIEQMGAQIGSHTLHHEILTRLPLDQAGREIEDSKAVIESCLGHPCRVFAYPNGNWSPEVRDLVVQQGYAHAFINSPGIWSRETDPWLIPRVNIWEGSLSDASGSFSPIVFQYSAFWRAYRAEKKRRKLVTPSLA